MSLKYGILCLLLSFIVLILVLKNVDIWTHPLELPPGKGAEKKAEKKPEAPAMVREPKDTTSIKSYILISEKNIFHPERKEFPILQVEGKKPVVRPQVVLYGVTITGDYQTATLANPGRPLKKGERESMTLKTGDQIGEYKLAKIALDRITLEAGEDSFEVLLYDPRAPKKRVEVKTETKPATVTSAQPAPAPRTTGSLPSTAPTGGPVPTSPPTSIGTSKPTAPGEQVATPPPTIPVRPTVPSTDIRRGRRPFYTPPPSTPTQNMGGN